MLDLFFCFLFLHSYISYELQSLHLFYFLFVFAVLLIVFALFGFVFVLYFALSLCFNCVFFILHRDIPEM